MGETQLMMFFMALLTGIAIENAVFTRALGISKTYLLMNSSKMVMLYGSIFTWLLVVSSIFIGIVNTFASAWEVIVPLYIVCAGGVYVGTFLYLKHKQKELFSKIYRVLPMIAFNTALFGAFFIAFVRNFTITQTIGYSLGTGIGYTGALLILYYARKRLAISPVPRAFRGLPIMFLYIGFLSLAFYGLIGHGLPM